MTFVFWLVNNRFSRFTRFLWFFKNNIFYWCLYDHMINSRILIFCQKFWNNDRILAKCHKIKNYKSINQAISEILKHFYVNINISLAFTPRMVFDSALFYQNLLQSDPSYSLALLKLPDYVTWLWRVVKSRFCHISDFENWFQLVNPALISVRILVRWSDCEWTLTFTQITS